MDICLLCDEPMHIKPDSDLPLDLQKKYKHKEHIIQNALGGRLKSSNILCKSCGGILNDEIDVDFNKLFSPITARIKDFAKDRNAKANVRLQGVHVDSDMKIRYDGKIPVPLHPTVKMLDEEQKVIIYCQKAAIGNFRKSVIKRLEQEKKEHYTIEEVCEFPQSDHVWLSFSKDIDDFNDKWKMGFIKIATEFAYLHGIPKDQLTLTLDRSAKKLIFSDNLYPFVPVTAVDHLLEYNRNIIERDYPTHTLHLFTQSYSADHKRLICYIDLFSTFQYYVLLTDSYHGPEVMRSYKQKILTEEKFDLDIRSLRPKELMQEAQHYGIDISNAPASSLESIYEYFEKEYAKLQPAYELDLKNDVRDSLEILNKTIIYSRLPESLLPPLGPNKELLNFLRKFSSDQIVQVALELLNFYDRDEKLIIERFRQVYIENNLRSNDRISMLDKCIEIAGSDINQVQEYGHYKFEFLSYYLNVQQNFR